MIEEFYKNSTTGDILRLYYSENIKGLGFHSINGKDSVDDVNPDLTGYVVISEKKALRELKKKKNASVSH